MDSLEFSLDEFTYSSLLNEKKKSGFENKTWDEWFQYIFEFKKKSQQEKMENAANKFFYDKNFEQWVKNFAINLNDIWKDEPTKNLQPDSPDDKNDNSAIVLGGGPAIKKFNHLEILAKSDYKGTIICTDKILVSALKAGITPEKFPKFYVATIDTFYDIWTLYDDEIVRKYGKKINGVPTIKVLKDVNIAIERGHTVGVIGESGCGKSTLARVMSGLLSSSKGEVLLDGDILAPSLKNRNRSELQKIQFVFQMADTALNPRQRIDQILGRPLEFYLGLRGGEKRKKIIELLEMVELPQDFAGRYPDELSGGQKQRINLARALAAAPEVLLCDEVISALDSIVGANVIELLKRLRKKTGVSFVFISHDLSTVASFADEIVVLYAGRVVEQGPVDQVLSPPYHPYTRLLISSVPELRLGWLEKTMETQEAQAGIDRVVQITDVGCPFFDRCPIHIEGTCDNETPPIRNIGRSHQIECHLEETKFLN